MTVNFSYNKYALSLLSRPAEVTSAMKVRTASCVSSTTSSLQHRLLPEALSPLSHNHERPNQSFPMS